MLTTQILSLIPLMSIDLPEILEKSLMALRHYSFVPNMYEYIAESSDGEELYSLAQDNGYDTSVFLINCGQEFSHVMIGLLLFPIVAVLKGDVN